VGIEPKEAVVAQSGWTIDPETNHGSKRGPGRNPLCGRSILTALVKRCNIFICQTHLQNICSRGAEKA